MSEYAAHVATTAESATDDQLDTLVDELAPYAGVPSLLGGRLSVQLTIRAGSLLGAQSIAQKVVGKALDKALLVPVFLVGAEVLEQAEFERRLALPVEAPDLIPTIEAADVLDVSRQRVLQLMAKHPDFPEPVMRGARGLYHSRAALLRFLAGWDRSAGPRNRTGANS